MAALLDIITKDSINRSVTLRIIDATTGVPKSDVVFNSAGLDLWYRREGAVSVDVTEVTLAALTTAHTDGGFLLVNDGEYRLDLPDAAFATGANYVDVGGTVTGGIVIGGRVRLVNYSLEDSVRMGLTALPNAAADAAGGLMISDAGGLDADAQRADVAAILVDTAEIGAAGAGLTNINLPNQTMDITGNITGNLSGSVGSVTGAVGSVTAAITLPTIPTNWITATGINADAFTAAKFASDVTTELQTGLATADKMLGYFQLALRSDAGIATDRAAELTEINADEGSGAGAYDNTDSPLITLPTIPTNWITADGLAADAVTEIQSGLATQTSVNDLPTNAELATALGTLNDLDSTEAQAAAAAALVAIHLDHWVAVADPGGVVANNSFLAKLVSKSATATFTDFVNTTDSLQALSDNDFSSLLYNRIWKMVAFAGAIGATGNDTTHIHLSALTYPDDEINGQLLVLQDNSAAGITYSRVVLDWDQASALATVALLPITPQASTDTAYLFSIRPGEGGGLDAAGVRAAIGMASANLDTQLAAIDLLAGLNVYATGTADAGSSQILLVDAERTEANGGYFTNSRVVMTSGANAGQSRPILSFSAASDTIVLSESFQDAIAAGDTYAIVNDHSADVNLWGHSIIAPAINGMLPTINVAVNASGFSYTGTADGGSTTTLDDSDRIGDGDDFWNGNKILFTNGNLAGIERLIVDYNSTSGTFTLAPPLPNAVTTQAYAIVSASMQDANATHWIGTEITEQPHTDATLRAAFGLAAANLDDRTLTPTAASSANSMWENVITVDDATEAPTTTVFETDQTTDSAARYNEAVLTTRTGTNPAGISRMVTAYAFTNGKVKLTLGTPLPSAPADGDTFTLMGLIDQ